MKRLLPAVVGVLVAVLFGGALGQDRPKKNKPGDWVAFFSREGESGQPKLAVVYADGTKKEYEADADAVVIAGRPDRAWGRLDYLAVSLSDTNRFLIRFPELEGKIKSAELVLTVPPLQSAARSKNPPAVAFPITVSELKAEWDEEKVTWGNQPEPAGQPLAAAIDPGDETVRIDVTALAQRLADPKADHFGWVLAPAKPLKVEGMPPGSGRDGPEKEVLSLLPWAKSVPAAVKQAGDDKLVLAVVRATYTPDDTHYAEQMLLAAVLSEPDVRRRVLARFVPVRATYNRISYVYPPPANVADPLADLGVKVADVKAPALVVTDGKGKKVAVLESIGTFDRDLILRFLDSAQAKAKLTTSGDADPMRQLDAGDFKAAEAAFAKKDDRGGKFGLARVASVRGDHAKALELAKPLAASDGDLKHEAQLLAGLSLVRLGRFADAEPLLKAAAGSKAACAGEAAYLHGCALARTNPDAAVAVWQDLVKAKPTAPEAIRAKARLAWPEALADAETLVAFPIPADLTRTEIDRTKDADAAVRRGVEYLLSQQAKDGSWSPSSQAGMYQVAITALAVRSLHKWAPHLEKDLGAKAKAASEAGTKWLNKQVGEEEPETFNSFAAAYLLDYFVDLEESKAAVRGDTKGAVRLLLAGQMKNGAWSYSLEFGTNWRGGIGGWAKTDLGRAHSVNTGQALLALARAKAAGFDVDKKSLEAGTKALLAMRESPAVFTYTYPEPRTFHEKPEQSIARAPLCEQALRLLDANKAEDCEKAVALFLKHRGELRPVVKLTDGWVSKVGSSSYFFYYAYDHAARAIIDNGTDAKDRLAQLKADILKAGEADGSWVDFEAVGKSFGTAMALHVLFLAR